MSSDDDLLARLEALLADDDPPPAAVVAAARDSYRWRDIDAELASLTADSLLAAEAVRGEQARLLTYRAGGITIEVEVTESAGRLRVLGQLVPPRAARVRIEQPQRAVEADVRELGRFRAEELPPGPTRFVCTPAGASPVRTEWTIL